MFVSKGTVLGLDIYCLRLKLRREIFFNPILIEDSHTICTLRELPFALIIPLHAGREAISLQ